MAYSELNLAVFPSHFGIRAKGQYITTLNFEDFVDPNSSGTKIVFAAYGNKIGSIRLDVENTIFRAAKFSSSFLGGPEQIEIELADYPDFPILKFMTFQYFLGDTPIWIGYIDDHPQGPKKGVLKLTGKGPANRLKDNKILLPEFSILSITKSGSYERIKVSEPIPDSPGNKAYPIVGQKIIVRKPNNSANETKDYTELEEIDFEDNEFVIYNPLAVTDSNPIGKVMLLPAVCSGIEPKRIDEVLAHFAEFYNDDMPISYNPNSLEETTGIFVTGTMDVNGLSFWKLIQNLDLYLSGRYRIFINNYGEYSISKVKNDSYLTTLFAGYDFQNPDFRNNYSSIKNSIIVKRKIPKGKEKLGLETGGISADSTSIKKYGLSQLTVDLPYYATDEDCQTISDALLMDKKDPKISGKIQRLKFKKYEHGFYKVVDGPGIFNEILDECDSIEDWDYPSGVTGSVDSNILFDGIGSIKLQFTDSDDEKVIKKSFLEPYFPFAQRRLLLWIRGNQRGQYLQIGIGKLEWDEYTTFLPINNAGQFEQYGWDIKNYSEDEINFFGIKLINPPEDAVINLDSIRIEMFGNRHYVLRSEKCIHSVSNSGSYVDIEFGEESSKLSDYISSINSKVDTARIVSED